MLTSLAKDVVDSLSKIDKELNDSIENPDEYYQTVLKTEKVVLNYLKELSCEGIGFLYELQDNLDVIERYASDMFYADTTKFRSAESRRNEAYQNLQAVLKEVLDKIQ